LEGFREVVASGLRALVREDVADFLLSAGALDVWKLAVHPSARLLAMTRRRLVFRVSLPRDDGPTLELVVRIFLQARLRDVLRGFLRRARGMEEWETLKALEGMGIAAAPRVAVGGSRVGPARRADFIITEARPDALPLDRLVAEGLPAMPAADRRRLTVRVASVLADLLRRLHDGGMRHDGLDAGDVLVRWGRDGSPELLLAGGGRLKRRRTVPAGVRIADLVRFNRFFSMLVSRTARMRFWNRYVEGVPVLQRRRREYARLIEEHTVLSRGALWRRLEGRCLHTDGRFRGFRVGRLRGFTVRGSIELSDETLAAIPGKGLVMPDAVVFKDSKTTGVWEQKLDFGPEVRTIIIKHKKRRQGLKFLRTFSRHVGAMWEWRVAYAMKIRGLPVVNMLAAFERRRLGLLLDSYLITEKIENAEDLRAFIGRTFAGERSARGTRLRRDVARSLARVIRRVHAMGFSHHDLKSSNVLVRRGGGPGGEISFVLVDFEGARQHARTSRRHRVGDVARLAANFVNTPAVRRTDMMRFLDEYLVGADVTGARRRALVAAINRKIRGTLERWKAKGY
jgi:tRNA A-37 threonylcarbamoyl transferase component Bud32